MVLAFRWRLHCAGHDCVRDDMPDADAFWCFCCCDSSRRWSTVDGIWHQGVVLERQFDASDKFRYIIGLGRVCIVFCFLLLMQERKDSKVSKMAREQALGNNCRSFVIAHEFFKSLIDEKLIWLTDLIGWFDWLIWLANLIDWFDWLISLTGLFDLLDS